MWKQNIKILNSQEWYDTIFDEYGKFHVHLDSFDKWVFTRFLPRKQDMNVLDLWAGDWRLYKYLKNFSIKNYVACDISPKLLWKHPGKVKKTICDIEQELPFESDYFDCVTSFFVLEYIENLKQLFEEVYRILKPEWVRIVGHFIQRKQFTWKKWFQFRIKMHSYRLEDLQELWEQAWFKIHVLPCYENNSLIWWVLVFEK